MNGVTLESCQNIIEQFEPCPENKSKGVLGIDGEWALPSAQLLWGAMGNSWGVGGQLHGRDKGTDSACGAG